MVLVVGPAGVVVVSGLIKLYDIWVDEFIVDIVVVGHGTSTNLDQCVVQTG